VECFRRKEGKIEWLRRQVAGCSSSLEYKTKVYKEGVSFHGA
jgi:hypothetical protein